MRDGGAPGLPVVCRMPPTASPMLPKPASAARGPVWPKPEIWVSTSPGLSADSTS